MGQAVVPKKKKKPETQALFTGPQGSDAKEWAAWRSKDACEVLSPAEGRGLCPRGEARAHRADAG